MLVSLPIVVRFYKFVLFFHMRTNPIATGILFIIIASAITTATSLKFQTEDECLEYKLESCVSCRQDYHLHNN
jgi:hypothetical protein